ncbi:MAG: SpoIIE family protein phosphatase [Candidatus Zixiibacteriota bacterium]|nr:MAG: SpoIIE family protein phosphatase [candidate division Zixibacteria bacterium]
MPNNLNPESERLRKALDELVALNQIANAINALMSVDKITQTIVDHCLKKIQASQGAVFLLDERDKEADKFKTFIREFSTSTEKIPFHVNESLTGWIIKNKTMFASNDPDNDDRFKWMHLTKLGINSILAAPLLSRTGLIGSLILFNKKDSEGFTEEDKRFLGIVGSQTAKVIENARLKEQEQELVAMRQEMMVAQSIQKGFLPKSGVKLQTCEACGFNIPAKEVGGDFFDIVRLNDEKVFLSLGDVSGKGMPAALLMANAQAVLRSHLLGSQDIHLSELARSLNHLICEFTSPEQFITCLFGLFDSADNCFRYINAGHEPPIVVRDDGAIEVLDVADIVIGVVPEIVYSVHEIKLNKNDILIIFTDGVTEAFNEEGVQFGDERLKELLKGCVGGEGASVGEQILTTLSTFRGKSAQTDDITMLLLKVS